ncbi:MAG: glycoside hydrolase family 97 catalytic domain-containing protein [Phocaeicola sp.]
MKKQRLFYAFALLASQALAQSITVTGPDTRLKVDLAVNGGIPMYSVSYDGKTILEKSPLGFIANTGNFSQGMSLIGQETSQINKTYTQDRIKRSVVNYAANELTVRLQNTNKQPVNIVFRVSNNDVAFRYEIPKSSETGSMVINEEKTGFDFPEYTTTFLTPQSDAMIGWKRTKPSYEEEYTPDAPMNTRSQYGHGYTFPGLFRIGNDGWALVSETGVDSKFCASRLSDATPEGLYTIAYPMPEENNGNGTSAPGIALPGVTPWRTITVGNNLKPIVETTVPWDVVEPRYESEHTYQFGRGTWSWILWQDGSINFDDQIRYINLAAAMGYEFFLIDNWWDKNIGHKRMEELARYAQSKNVSPIVWYSSSGYWNDIEQSPTNIMDNPITRKREMKWLQKIGAKGIKVDFFGGDKQETMRLYEAILSDADDHGLMVIFHGCTLPRGWERMYPNYVGSEAVLASENLIFNQHFNDNEAFNACLHPFIRNAVGSMEFGGTFLNKRYNRTNDGGTTRCTSDIFQLATAVLFQNPIQNFALAPNNLTDAPEVALDFMKQIPTTWDETVFIDGYPGKYAVLARRHGNRWYIAGINAQKEPLKLSLNLPMLNNGDVVVTYTDGKQGEPQRKELSVKTATSVPVTIQPNGGVILMK